MSSSDAVTEVSFELTVILNENSKGWDCGEWKNEKADRKERHDQVCEDG
jgi:hypothetical protein